MNHSALDVNKTAGSGFVLALFVPAVLSLFLISSQASGLSYPRRTSGFLRILISNRPFVERNLAFIG